MNIRPLPLLLAVLIAAPAGAEISRDDLKKALDANPDLVLAALKKADKSKFFEYVIAAQNEFQARKQKEEAEREQKEMEAAYKNPLKPDLSGSLRMKGKADAPITIVEYSDFQCPYCKQGYANVETMRKIYGDKLRVVFKNKPLHFHPLAMPAAKWFEALALQSPEKAMMFHDSLFENQDKLGEDYYKKLTKDLGLDVAKAQKDAESDGVKKKIAADMAEADKFGMEGTPGYLVNGVPIRGAYPPEVFAKVIDKLGIK